MIFALNLQSPLLTSRIDVRALHVHVLDALVVGVDAEVDEDVLRDKYLCY